MNVIFGADVEQVGVDVPVKFGDSSSNGSRDIQQRSRPMRQFRPFLNFDNCQPEAVSDVISGQVNQDVGMDIRANFGDSRLKPSEASFFGRFSNVDNVRPEVHSDVMSGAIIDRTGVKVPVQFGESRSNRSRDIRLPPFVPNDNDAGRWTL